MDEKERLRLQKEYSFLSDKELIDLFKTDKGEFTEGVYQIVIDEANRRGLKQKIKKSEELKKLQQESLTKRWVEVYPIFDLLGASIIEDILNKNNIPAVIQYYDAVPVYQLYSNAKEKGVIRVEKKDEAKAIRIINDFEKNKE